MIAQYVLEGTTAEKLQRMVTLIERHAPALTRTEREERLRVLMATPTEHLLQQLAENHRTLLRSIGVHCFAGDPRSVLMWNHYGSEHQGICYQFEIARDPETFFHALNVEYSEDLPKINWIHEFNLRWSGYCCENIQFGSTRPNVIIVPEGANWYRHFKDEALTAIIVGCRTTDGTRERVKELLAERIRRGLPPARLYCLRQHASKYELVARRFA